MDISVGQRNTPKISAFQIGIAGFHYEHAIRRPFLHVLWEVASWTLTLRSKQNKTKQKDLTVIPGWKNNTVVLLSRMSYRQISNPRSEYITISMKCSKFIHHLCRVHHAVAR